MALTDDVVSMWVRYVDPHTHTTTRQMLDNAKDIYLSSSLTERYMLVSAYMSNPVYSASRLRAFIKEMHIAQEARHLYGYVVPLFVVAVMSTDEGYSLSHFYHGVGLRIIPIESPTREKSYAIVGQIARYDAETQNYSILLSGRKYRGRKITHIGGDMTKHVIMCYRIDDWRLVPKFSTIEAG